MKSRVASVPVAKCLRGGFNRGLHFSRRLVLLSIYAEEQGRSTVKRSHVVSPVRKARMSET